MLALSPEGGLAALQRSCAEAIFFDDVAIPATIRQGSGPAYAGRFGVYRNNVIAGLINAVAARYPVVRRLLWEDAFNRAAYRYVTTQPPRSPVMLNYGETFPRFLRSIGQGAAANCVADIAELESARTRAYHAADAVPLAREQFVAVPPEQWPELRLKLHPSLVLLKSGFPMVSMWQANLTANDNMLGAWQPECALVVRPYLDVEVRSVTAGVFALITALAAGTTVGAAIERASGEAPRFDLGEAFRVLVDAGIVIGIVSAAGDN
jgi:hypothetical protein